MKKIILVTGATDGIGKQTALELAKSGHKIIVHGRTKEKAQLSANEIIDRTGNKEIEFAVADFSSLKEVRRLADEIKERFDALNVLINNAGVYKKKKEITEDGFEATFAINHLAPFLLTNLIIDILLKNAPSRIINVSSVAHQRGKIDFENLNAEKCFDGYGSYSLSKLANIIFSNELADKLKNTKVTVNSLHPGVIGTKLLKEGFGMGGASIMEGAETSIFLATSDEVENVSGKYFDNKKISTYSKVADDEDVKKKLWELSEKMTGLKTVKISKFQN